MADDGERLRLQLVGGESRELPMEGVLTIGSATQGVDWTIDAQGVADVHCVVGRAKGGGWAVKDMGSRYGTLINGKRIKYARLAAGDQVLLGSRRMQVISLASPATITPIAPAEPVPSPLQIAGYRLERPLGHGGMGLVYLAEQESLSRKVALKILSARLSHDTDFVNRFLAEARAAAALNHPNVVTVHDVGESGGQHYLSMEYMDRGNLEARVAREGPLSWVETLRVMKDAASALVFAEGKGIVHRDIKPANLMQNSAGVTKLADLGLATHLEAQASDSGDRKIFGTPHFISPEQARGERVDSRSDLYSLGATMYRLLTGHTPFEGESTRDILRGHFSERPRPPTEWVVGLPEGLERMVMRLLEKKPDLRYPSAGVLLREVQALRNGGEPAAVRAPVEEASGHRGLKVAVVGGIAAVALLWIGLKIVGSGPEPQPPPDGPGTAQSNGEGVEPGTGDGIGGAPPPVEPVDPPGDDDRDMRLLEVEAENAYLKIDASLSDEQRLGPLAAIVEDFRGTTTASRASEEMREIQNRLLEREAAERARKSEHEQHLAALRGLAELEADPPRPGPALRQMLAHDLPAPLAADSEFQARRRELFRELIETARRGLGTTLESVEAMVKRGEFDLAGETLRGLQPGLDLPELPPDLALSELGELHLIAGDVRALLRDLDDREETFLARRSREDARAGRQPPRRGGARGGATPARPGGRRRAAPGPGRRAADRRGPGPGGRPAPGRARSPGGPESPGGRVRGAELAAQGRGRPAGGRPAAQPGGDRGRSRRAPDPPGIRVRARALVRLRRADRGPAQALQGPPVAPLHRRGGGGHRVAPAADRGGRGGVRRRRDVPAGQDRQLLRGRGAGDDRALRPGGRVVEGCRALRSPAPRGRGRGDPGGRPAGRQRRALVDGGGGHRAPARDVRGHPPGAPALGRPGGGG